MRVCHKSMTHPHLFIGYLIHLISYSSDYAEESEHSCSTDYARNLNGNSTLRSWHYPLKLGHCSS